MATIYSIYKAQTHQRVDCGAMLQSYTQSEINKKPGTAWLCSYATSGSGSPEPFALKSSIIWLSP